MTLKQSFSDFIFAANTDGNGNAVLVGKGRQSRYELKSNRARIAPVAPNAEQRRKPSKNKGNQGPTKKGRWVFGPKPNGKG